MTRLPYVRRDQLDDETTAMWDTVVAVFGDRVVNEEGGLRGPFNAMVTAPHIGALLRGIRPIRERSSIPRRLEEVAIITTGAQWRAEFEWAAHAEFARAEGISEEVIDAIGRGAPPPFTQDDERVVHTLARQLATDGHIDAATYEQAQAMFGDVGIIELVAVCGYYALVSYILNAFEVPPPPDATWSLAVKHARDRDIDSRT